MDGRIKSGHDGYVHKKNPALRRDFPALAWSGYGLAILVGVILIGVLSLTVRVLLLLAGLLAAALLLTGFLARILVLLAGLVLIGHLEISLVERSPG
jgi:hypothetical protein